MRRIAKKRKVSNPNTDWWVGSYVLARLDQDGDYCPENVIWRLARNDHEAQMGLEEITENEPVWLPMTTQEKSQRDALKTQNDRRLYDIHMRMLMRCGEKNVDEDAEYFRVESTAFPAGWKPRQEWDAEQAQN